MHTVATDAVVTEFVPAERLRRRYIWRCGMRDGAIIAETILTARGTTLSAYAACTLEAARKLGYAANHVFWGRAAVALAHQQRHKGHQRFGRHRPEDGWADVTLLWKPECAIDGPAHMRAAMSGSKLRRARFIVKWGAELHRLRIPFTGRVVLPLNVKGLEKSLAEVHEVFTRHGIRFWLRNDTALGVVRNGGIIARDDDVDLGNWPEELPALEHALRDLEDIGFVVYKHNRWIIGLLKRWRRSRS